jgi:hypothetical protein
MNTKTLSRERIGNSMTLICEKDKAILKKLAEKKIRIAALPIQDKRATMWRKLNHLENVKPMVWTCQIHLNEFGIELQLETVNPLCRILEYELRTTIYQWEHIQGDMVVESKIYCPLVIQDTGFGIEEVSEKISTSDNGVPSRHFTPQIKDEKDIEKIKDPLVTIDTEATAKNYQFMVDVFGDILSVEKRGAQGFWFAPWDQLVTWWGVEDALRDLILRPDLLKLAMDRLTKAYLSRLRQYEHLNALSLNNNNVRVGSGGLGYTNELPQNGFKSDHVRSCDLWGCAAAQIFSEVSPEMHEEFAINFELQWLSMFGLNYYGCCEPLHKKIDRLKLIPNLRKVSMSPWADIEEGANKIGKDYVFSLKPNPAIFAEKTWDPQKARLQLRSDLQKANGCAIEVIMKDVSTVRNEPRRLWEWSKIATEVTEEFA